ncbi:hypothetical protein [Burkholderia sp. BCC1972]|uniref:hypothetical protein n=1 Tax=Burkholderia sp. BCC1972 TaxID=2817438 RepID=UPI002ABD9AF3|nr:hypothetical protein [Burkholderia sp. BCC1972]
MIEDGDIGYEGEYHASFVRARLPRVGGRATEAGSSAARTLVAFVRERFAERSAQRGGFSVAPAEYQLAVASVMGVR